MKRPGVNAAVEHLLVERNDQVRIISGIGNRFRPEAYAVPASARPRAARRLDLRRNNLNGPEAVSVPCAQVGEHLAASLRTFPRITNDLNDVLVYFLRFRPAGHGR